MKRSVFSWKLESFGRYTAWNRDAKALPDLLEITDTIVASEGVEFGYVLNIFKAKGKKLTFSIEHPPFLNEAGEVTPAFTGEVYVRSNNWEFFLGDTLWLPLEDKLGSWRLITTIDDQILADKQFEIVLSNPDRQIH